MIYELTREPKAYESAPATKLKDCCVDTEEILWGIPRDDLPHGLLWHAVYKPFWNESARHSPAAQSWSWVSLNQRVGWPEYSGGRVRDDVVHVEDLEGENIQADGESVVDPSDLRSATSSRLSLVGGAIPATLMLHDNTKRKCSLTGPALPQTLTCTMDCDSKKRDASVLKLLTRQLKSGLFCTHCLVFEAFLDDDQPNLSASDQKFSDDGVKISVKKDVGREILIDENVQLYERVGTARLNH